MNNRYRLLNNAIMLKVALDILNYWGGYCIWYFVVKWFYEQ
jgi:hypothetical protein